MFTLLNTQHTTFLKQHTVHIIGAQPCVTYADHTAQWWIQDNNYVGRATYKLLVASVSTDVRKAVTGPLSLASAQGPMVSQVWFHSDYTHVTINAKKNALPPEIQPGSRRGPADLAYLPRQTQIPKQVTHLTPEAVSTVTTSHGDIRLVLPLTHPLVIPWWLRSWQQSWVRGSLVGFNRIGSKPASHVSTVIWAAHSPVPCNAKCPSHLNFWNPKCSALPRTGNLKSCIAQLPS